MAFETYINNSEIGMTDKARIDTKNAGMSIVAELLGCPNVICRAQPMKIRDAKGNLIEGTFMQMAKGVDPNRPTREGQNASKSSLNHTDGRGLESIADLQVIDYICGNVDRHGGNLFYQFDEKGKFIGDQGIDNDSSFGTKVPQLSKDAVRRLPVAPNMGAISKKTADIIMNTSPAELAFTLRGTIDEPSIQACCDRLYVMQHVITLSRRKLDPNTREIKYPYLRELTTKEFAEADIEKLADKTHKNHFYEIRERMTMIGATAKVANEPLSTKMVGSENRATQAGIFGQYVNALDMSKMRQGLLKIKAAADKYATEKVAEVHRNGKQPEDDQYIKGRQDRVHRPFHLIILSIQNPSVIILSARRSVSWSAFHSCRLRLQSGSARAASWRALRPPI